VLHGGAPAQVDAGQIRRGGRLLWTALYLEDLVHRRGHLYVYRSAQGLEKDRLAWELRRENGVEVDEFDASRRTGGRGRSRAQAPTVVFVHGYALAGADAAQVLATADYGGPVVAVVAKANRAGTQFHVEKSQDVGLRILTNFLRRIP